MSANLPEIWGLKKAHKQRGKALCFGLLLMNRFETICASSCLCALRSKQSDFVVKVRAAVYFSAELGERITFMVISPGCVALIYLLQGK